MGSQSQHHFSPESVVVRDLENKLADSTTDLAQIYQQLRQDPAVVLALRYLTLAVIASKLNLYAEHRSAAILVDEISQQMNATNPNQLLTSIRYLKLRHRVVYSLNPIWFDRAAAIAVDCINHALARRANSPASANFDFEAQVSSSRLRFDPQHPPTKMQTFRWSKFLLSTAALLGSGLLIGLLFNLDRLNLPQLELAWTNRATASPQDSGSSSNPVVASLPSPAPATVADVPLPVLAKPNRSISPIPMVMGMGMSKPIPSTTTAQPTQDSSQFITSQLSAPFYQKVVAPETVAQPSVSPAPPQKTVNLGAASSVEPSLKRICEGQLKICRYGFKKQTIIVTLLPEYTNKIQQVTQEAMDRDDSAAKIGLSNHIQSLNDTLELIGQNSAMPLELYGSNGKLLQKYIPKKPEQLPKVTKIE
jgi:hypothetical protein